MTGKKPLILALVLFNAALMGMLVVLHSTRQAQAQVIPQAVGRFTAVTQAIDDDKSLLWVVDTNSRRLAIYTFDRSRGKLRDVKRLDLKRIFRYRGEGRPDSGRDTKPPRT